MADNDPIASTRQFRAFVDQEEYVSRGPSTRVRLIAAVVAGALVLSVAATAILIIAS